MCRFIVWYQVWSAIIRLYILPPGHWTCSIVCHFNFMESPAAVSAHWTYRIHCHLCSTRYSFTPVSSKALEGEVPFPRTQYQNNVPIELGVTWHLSENPVQSRVGNCTAGSDIGKGQRSWDMTRSLSITVVSLSLGTESGSDDTVEDRGVIRDT